MPPPIPDRWIPYKACGRVIEGTRFICFKVPLRKAVQVGKSEIKEIWDIKALLQKIPNLGAVIDLTNTNRYYDPRELAAAGVLHQKILMPGRIVPPEQQVQLFMDTVDEFLGKDCVAVQVKRARLGLSTTDLLIGVHCTHGLNRTGYMVCRYMRDRLNIPARIAIKRFQKARGYEIERENYIADLLGKKPPPPDLGKQTRVKPIEGKKELPEKEEDENLDEAEKNRDAAKKTERSGQCSEKNWRSAKSYGDWRSEPRTGRTRENQESSSNWRDEPRKQRSTSRKDDNNVDSRLRKSRTDNTNGWRRNRTDSERSYDFRYDY